MNLTLRQRVIVSKVASIQKGDLLTMELWEDIRNKTVLTDTERDLVFKPIPNSNQVLVDLTVFDGEGINIDYEKAERRVMLDALPQYREYETGEPVWVRKLIKELEESLSVKAV